MIIGIFTDTYEPQINGVVTSIKTSIEYLEQNHTIYVFCPNVTPKIQSTETVWRFPSVVYPFQKEYRLALPFNHQLKNIKALNLDIIHIHTPFTMGKIGLKIGKKLNLPIIHTYHTYFEKYLHYFPILPERWVHKYAKKESERFCNACNKIIVPSHEMKSMLSSYQIDTELSIIPSGINCHTPTQNEITQFKKRYMQNNKINCIFVGRVGKEKNIHFLIDAFEKILTKEKNVHLTIIGDGPEKKGIQQKSKTLEITEHVSFTGYLTKENVFQAYHAADLMLFPSTTETQGLTVVESIMCGTPVIGINKMGVKNVIKQNESGILTEENVDEFANAALSLIKNDKLRLDYASKAIQLGKAYSYTTTGKALENLYKEFVKS